MKISRVGSPEEKADELFYKHLSLYKFDQDAWLIAKEEAVDEVNKTIDGVKFHSDLEPLYWLEVKRELEMF